MGPESWRPPCSKRDRTRRRARFWLLLAALAWIASLGPLLKIFDSPISLTADGHPSYVALPWALVQNLPILNLIRTPVRFNFTIGLAVAILVGYGAFVVSEWLARRWSRRAANGLLTVAALLLVVDFQWFVPVPAIDAEIPAAVRALSAVGAQFSHVNIFEDPELREALKQYSNWPTYPQLYVNGELVGGSDIILEMYKTGELQKLVTAGQASA